LGGKKGKEFQLDGMRSKNQNALHLPLLHPSSQDHHAKLSRRDSCQAAQVP
jgi:hypothetical protein